MTMKYPTKFCKKNFDLTKKKKNRICLQNQDYFKETRTRCRDFMQLPSTPQHPHSTNNLPPYISSKHSAPLTHERHNAISTSLQLRNNINSLTHTSSSYHHRHQTTHHRHKTFAITLHSTFCLLLLNTSRFFALVKSFLFLVMLIFSTFGNMLSE